MKFKLDETFGRRIQELFRSRGHETSTVRDQGLGGASDSSVYRVCCEEGHCIVTLDLDFADITRFRPEPSDGIVVIRLPKNPTYSLLERVVSQFLDMVARVSVEKQLWIVEVGRIRVHQLEKDE